jgi:single-strand DNA-binding protein
MAGEPVVTIVGNATGDAELRFLASGAAVANFTVAQTPRTKKGDEWEDGETMFVRCAAWRDLAEHVAESVKRGMRLVVTGRMHVRSYETNEGEKRTNIELTVDDVGASMRFATVTAQRAERTSAPQSGDPWSTATPPAPWAQQQGQAPAWGQPQGNPTQQGQQPLPPSQPPGYGYQGQPQTPAPGGWGPPPPGDEPPF